jgi:pilus assembly protein Flp/PilA
MLKTTTLGPRGGDDSGASAVEYGLLLAAIAAVVVAAVFLLGGAAKDLFVGSCNTIDSQANTNANCSG